MFGIALLLVNQQTNKQHVMPAALRHY